MVFTGLSGNEIYCLNKKGFKPGNIAIGNSVFSMGLLGGIGSAFNSIVGGEIPQYTNMIAEGRQLSLSRLESEIKNSKGATGVTSELVMHPGNIEFLSIGSSLEGESNTNKPPFTSSSNGQELYCQIDSGYDPLKFVFGNVAYSIGLGRGILGSLKTLARGEIKEFTEIFGKTRNLALSRIVEDSKPTGANSVVGIRTTIIPFSTVGMQEMLMIGTASHNPNIPKDMGIVTSDLTTEEMWNITSMGYVPYKLLIGTSVYSLGLIGNIASFLKNFTRGEISQLTTLIYDAREESLNKISTEAQEIGADDVIGIKTYVYSLGNGLIEFLAIGTAIKYVGPQIKTESDTLLPQAIIQDKDTFYNGADLSYGFNLNKPNN